MINLKAPIKEIDGSDVKGLTVGKALANFVLAGKSDPLRNFLLAQKLATQDEIELDKADFQSVKDLVKENAMTVYTTGLVAGQLLLLLSEKE